MQPAQNNNVPSVKQPGNWSPFDNYTNDVQPPKKSIFAQYKKLIIVSGIAIVLLIGLAVLASTTSTKQGLLPGASTDIEMISLDNSTLTISYPTGLVIGNDAVDEQGDYGLFLSKESSDNLGFLSVSVLGDDPLYGDATEGLTTNQNLGVVPTNIVESDVIMAGVQTKKAVGEITDEDGFNYYVAYASANIDNKFIMLTAQYRKDDTAINNSLDAMLGSIKLK